mmetsp:Transcript_82859/g.242929  ORF Transcript_82859/g.242929 Transcript_82859/m.242929 type:complete len:259 (-) Transcript_82859:729-1505(-)
MTTPRSRFRFLVMAEPPYLESSTAAVLAMPALYGRIMSWYPAKPTAKPRRMVREFRSEKFRRSRSRMTSGSKIFFTIATMAFVFDASSSFFSPSSPLRARPSEMNLAASSFTRRPKTQTSKANTCSSMRDFPILSLRPSVSFMRKNCCVNSLVASFTSLTRLSKSCSSSASFKPPLRAPVMQVRSMDLAPWTTFRMAGLQASTTWSCSWSKSSRLTDLTMTNMRRSKDSLVTLFKWKSMRRMRIHFGNQTTSHHELST